MFIFFFFNDTATTEIYTLSLHDALPICDLFCRTIRLSEEFLRTDGSEDRDDSRLCPLIGDLVGAAAGDPAKSRAGPVEADRKSTRLNSSHSQISYAVFCLKKKNIILNTTTWITPYANFWTVVDSQSVDQSFAPYMQHLDSLKLTSDTVMWSRFALPLRAVT